MYAEYGEMDIEGAIRATTRLFPFKMYMCEMDPSGEEVPKSVYNDICSTVLRFIQPPSRILDFGCGPCDKTAILQMIGYECCAFDDLQDSWHKIPENRAKLIKFAEACKINFISQYSELAALGKHKFDMVMLHHVLEHLHNSPRELLLTLLDLVEPRGLLFVTVPNAVNLRKRLAVLSGSTNLPPYKDFFWAEGAWRGHVREYVKDDLVQLAEYLDCDVLELRACDHMLERLPASYRRVYLLLTKLFDGWKDSWLLVARKKQGWSPLTAPALPPARRIP